MKSHIKFYYFLKAGIGILSLATIVLFVKYAGQPVYGQYALIVSVIFTINNMLSGWLNQVILKFYKKEEKNQGLLKFLLISLICSLIIGFLAVPISLFNYDLVTISLSILFLLGLLVYSVFGACLQKSFKFKIITELEVFRALILVGVPLLLFIFFDREITVEVLLLGIASAYVFPISFKIIKNFHHYGSILTKLKKTLNLKIGRSTIQMYLSYGLPMGLWLGIATMLNLSDRYIMDFFFGYEEVGVYSSVYDITYKITTFGLAPILSAIHPLIMNSYNEGTKEYIPLIKKSLKLQIKILPLLIAGIIGLSFFSVLLLNIETILFISIAFPVLIGAFLWNLAMIAHKILEVKNKTKKMLFYILISLITNIAGNIIFLPLYGFTVAAYTTIVSFLIYLLLVLLDLKKKGYE